MARLTTRMLNSGFEGSKIAAIGFFGGSMLGLSAAKTVGSLGLAMSAGFVGSALFLVPAMLLRHLAKNVFKFNHGIQFALDIALALAAAAVGAYCFGIAMSSMIMCAAIGVTAALVVDFAANILASTRQPGLLGHSVNANDSDICYNVGSLHGLDNNAPRSRMLNFG